VNDGGRFPGFDVLSQARRWDPVTVRTVLARLDRREEPRFFTPREQATVTALTDRLLGQTEESRIPLTSMIDARLCERRTDGWRYGDMPEDGQAWRDTLAYLDEDATTLCGTGFAYCPPADQDRIVQAVRDLGGRAWHGLPADHVWSLWTRYACTAFYSHPHAWNEIGFSGPAYPRGYKNAGVDRLEPFEVRDAKPADDPVRKGD
jgi:hypothetical protein